MTPEERIAKLEALLKRVRARGAEPRPLMSAKPGEAPAPPPVDAAPFAPPFGISPPRPPPRPEPKPVAAKPPPPPRRPVPLEMKKDLVPEPVRSPMTSLERLRTASPFDTIEETLDEPFMLGDSADERASARDSTPQLEVGEIGEAFEEDDEVVPISSRRPVAPEESLAELAFGAAQPAPAAYAPPPESGRLPAVPVVDFDGDITGVREAPKLPRAREADAPIELVAVVTRAPLASTAVAATFVGEAPRFEAGTLGELLEATLGL